MQQSEALELLKLGKNVFLTGAAGSGKTYVLNKYIKYLRSHQVSVAITASTGIAATHINGQTIHSWSGIGARDNLDLEDLERIKKNPRVSSGIRKAKVLIIDEVSMLHSRQLQLVEVITRSIRDEPVAFGGLQVVLCGDFFQLPPIADRSDISKFAFQSNAWQAADFCICYLEEQHRQTNDLLLSVLNQIRSNSTGEATRIPLRTRYKKQPIDSDGKPFQPTLLYSRNINVDSVNDQELKKLPGKLYSFQMTSKGFALHIENLKKSCLAPEILNLKIGSQVMFVKNDKDGRFVNGSRGIVESFEPESGNPEVRTLGGSLICAEPEEWRYEDISGVSARIFQIPLRLAWAITIHKSQGMTLDAAEVDLSDAFEPGMGYVALSRVKTLNGLKLMGLNDTALTVHPTVSEFDFKLQKQSAEARQFILGLEAQELENQQILILTKRFEGRLEVVEDLEAAVTEKSARKSRKPEKEATYLITKKMVEAGKTILEITAERNIKAGTVIDHLEKLKAIDQLPAVDYLKSTVAAKDFELILAAFKESQDGKLKPIVDRFSGEYSYETVKLVRLFVN